MQHKWEYWSAALVMGAVVGTAASTSEAALTPRDSTAFSNTAKSDNTTGSYEGTALPPGEDPAWAAHSGNTAGTASVSGGILNINADTVSDRAQFELGTAWADDIDPDTGYTLETRLQIVSAPEGEVAFVFSPRDGSQAAILRFLDGELLWASTGQTFAVNTTDDFHDYRLAWVPGETAGSGAYALWYDQQLLSDTLVGTNTTANAMVFGDLSDNQFSGNTDVDYIRWDTTGAYAPVPEPGSAALLGLAALMLVRKRRN